MPEPQIPLDPLPVPSTPPRELGARVRNAVERTPAPRAPLRERLALAVLAVPLALVAGPLGSRVVFGGRPLLRGDIAQLAPGELAPRLALLLLIAGVVTGVALAPGRRGLGPKALLLIAATLVVAPLYTLVSAVHPLRSPAGDAAARALHPEGLPCALVAFGVGGLALAAFGLALWRAVPVAPVLRGAALGAAAGAWAGLALFLQCPAYETMHIFVGHVLPVAAFAVAGAVVLPRLLRL